MNEELNEREMEQLERELRSHGDPYGSPEPDERYFANFRARVMERIAPNEAEPGFGVRVKEFFRSPLRMTLAAGALGAALLLYFYLQSSEPELPVAGNPQHEFITPEPQATPAPQQEFAAPVESVTEPKKRNKPQHMQQAPAAVAEEMQPAPEVKAASDATSEFDQIDELSLSDESEPVSYDKLSVDELEAILKTLEGANQ